MTIVEPGARHRRSDTDPLDAPTVRIVVPAQPHGQGKNPVARSRGWKLVRRLVLVSAAGFVAFTVLAVVLAITLGPTATAPTTTIAPAASPSPQAAPASAVPAPSASVVPAPVSAPSAAPVAGPSTVVAPPATPVDPVDPNASPAALARQGCQAYSSGVAEVVENAVASDDLAPALRVQMGLPADVNDPSGVALSAPFVVANAALGDAGLGDPKYQPIDDALNALSDTIEHADPNGDLSALGTADALVNSRCLPVLN